MTLPALLSDIYVLILPADGGETPRQKRDGRCDREGRHSVGEYKYITR